jgi:hypothetical protein
MIPDDQVEARKPLLTREQLRRELNARGYVISASYFNKICLWGKRPLYHLDAGLAWAEGRCKTPATAA